MQVDRIDQPQSRVIRNESPTTNQFTPTTDLAPGTYRAWVQAVSSSGALSAWSVPIEFVISQTDPVDLPSTDLSHLLTNRLTRIFATHPSAAPRDMTTRPEPDNPELIDLVFSQATEEFRMHPKTPCQRDLTHMGPLRSSSDAHCRCFSAIARSGSPV